MAGTIMPGRSGKERERRRMGTGAWFRDLGSFQLMADTIAP